MFKSKNSNITDNIFFGIKTCFCASRMFFCIKIGLLFSATVIPLVNIFLWKNILNQCIEGNNEFKEVFLLLALYLGLKYIAYIFECYDEYVNERYSEEVQFYIETVMIDKTSRMDLAYFDSAKMGDKIRQTRNNFDIMKDMTWVVFSIVSEVVNIFLTVIIVCSYKWWLGLITLITLIPYVICNKKYCDDKMKLEEKQIREKRKADYYNSAFSNDLLLFEIIGLLTDRIKRAERAPSAKPSPRNIQPCCMVFFLSPSPSVWPVTIAPACETP